MIYFYIAIGLAVSAIGFGIFAPFYAAHLVYTKVLKRESKAHWGREVSSDHPKALQMDEIGMQWQREHDQYRQDVHIVRDGDNLYGEYYDLGYDKAAIILSGRTESLRYGYYFAAPYSRFGCNILVIDPRAHGLSDGQFNTVGFEESLDALAWTRFLADSKGVKSVVYHGICIGAATGMLAITHDDCPACVRGIVTEGMFINFRESMKNHLIERKKPVFPILQCIDFWMKRYTGHSMSKGPVDVIGKLNKPILMLQSKEDRYSTCTNAKKLFALCGTEQKQLVLFDHGEHSMLRITDTEKYDLAITNYLTGLFSAKAAD